MIPILFEHNATEFTTHGLGDLTECTTCVASVNEDGEYELALEYPVTGYMFPELTINRIVVAKANDYDPLQAFRIYGYEKTINGIVKINCQHLSYDISNIVVKAFGGIETASAALAKLKTNAVLPAGTTCPFTFYSDITDKPHTDTKKFKKEEPASMRTILLDGDDSIKGAFGGDLVFDNWDIKLLKMAGEDRGVTINYGADLVDLTQEENISDMTTGVLPYYKHSNGNADQVVYGDIQYATGTFLRHRIVPLDVSQYFGSAQENAPPSKAQINAKAQAWIEAEEIGKPEINLTLEYASLGQDLRLHDAVTVHFDRMGIDVKSKVVKVEYDVLAERCTQIEVGKTRPSLLFSLEDASRLKRGLLPPNRIQNGSIGSNQLGGGSVGGKQLADGAVDDEAKIAEKVIKGYHINNGTITEVNLAKDSVTTDKLQDAAVAFIKLNPDVEAYFVDILVTKQMFTEKITLIDGVIEALGGYINLTGGSISCSNLNLGTGGYISSNGETYRGGRIQVHDTNTRYKDAYGHEGIYYGNVNKSTGTNTGTLDSHTHSMSYDKAYLYPATTESTTQYVNAIVKI